VVGTTIGLNSEKNSADYIGLYHGNAALLAEGLEVIQRTSAVILSALETPAAETAAQQDGTGLGSNGTVNRLKGGSAPKPG